MGLAAQSSWLRFYELRSPRAFFLLKILPRLGSYRERCGITDLGRSGHILIGTIPSEQLHGIDVPDGEQRVGAVGASQAERSLSLPTAAMTTSRSSQLPEVLTDRLDPTHSRGLGCRDRAPSPSNANCPDSTHHVGKAVMDEPGGQPQYVMQVSAKDGQLLSTVVGTFPTQSALPERPMCRICHEGGGQEELLSPCECAGTLGTIHRSCLEQWLSSSSTSTCELCHFQFSVQHKTRPLLEWIRSPGLRREKRTLFGDMVCFLVITPLATISGWLCLRGAVDHLQFSSRLEAVGLIALTVALFTIYLFWTLVSLRYHCRLYNEWRLANQRVVLLLPKSHASDTIPQQSLVGLPPIKRHSKETIV
ncbi:hypothetical protein GJAV_G00049670 [Gymnothorax javanicus]|nr:hypothetical protein GJAV_G00049670 [Gymnothorax javanicus]